MLYRLLLLVFSTCFVADQVVAQAAGPWPMFRGNAAHTGRSTHTGPLLPSLKWRADLDDRVYASPAIGPDGTAFVASSQTLFAIEPNGSIRWRLSLADFTLSSPALDDDHVFVGSTAGLLHAVDPATGGIDWTFEADGGIWASPVVDGEGTVYVATSTGSVVAVDADTGSEAWRVSTTGEVVATPAIDGSGRLYVVDLSGNGYVVQTSSGEIVHTFNVPSGVASSPAIVGSGTIVLGGLDGTLYSIDTETGATRWAAPLGGELVSSPAIGTDGTVYVGSTNNTIAAVDGMSGVLQWSVNVDGEVYASPALDAAGRLYVGTVDSLANRGSLYAITTTNVPAEVEWRHVAGVPLWSSPSIDADGTVLVASANTDRAAGSLMRIEPTSVRVEFGEEPVVGVEHPVTITPITGFRPTSGTLFYRRGGDVEFSSMPASPESGTDFTASVPAEFVTERGLEYYVALSDGSETRTFPTSNPQTHPDVRQVRVEEMELPESTISERNYHMVSVPLELEDPSIESVLIDDYGAQTGVTWRLFRWKNDGYREYPALTDSLTPGRAFFLVHRSGQPFTVEDGRSVSTALPATVMLQPGWNQIGVPFAFPVDWNDVAVTAEDDAGAVREIAFYDGQQMIQDVDAFNPLLPWTGYFVHNDLSRPVTLAFPPRSTGDAAGNASSNAVASSLASGDGYVLQLEARGLTSHLLDTQNWIGFAPRATDGDDAFDLREAPPPTEHLRLSIIEGETRYARSLTSAEEPGREWLLEIEMQPQPEKPQWVEIALVPEGERPAGYELAVVDVDRNEMASLVDSRLRVPIGGDAPVRHLRLLLGTPAFVADARDGASVPAPSFFLDHNAPNPFSRSTTIHYRTEQSAHVDLSVYDVMGRHVVTLVNREQQAGSHALTWDGRAANGQAVASGIYFYRLRAGSYTQSRSMTVLR